MIYYFAIITPFYRVFNIIKRDFFFKENVKIIMIDREEDIKGRFFIGYMQSNDSSDFDKNERLVQLIKQRIV